MIEVTRKKTNLEDTGGYQKPLSRMRIRIGLFITITGFFIFIVGAKPGWLGWDRSPVVGFVQIAVFLVGLSIICMGGYIGLLALWAGSQRSIAADIGLRLVSTGYVIAVGCGMADVFGFGSHTVARLAIFGIWQEIGVLIGEVVIALGFALMIPFRRPESLS